MDEPIPITRAEYEAKFGAPAVTAAPIPITRAEYAAKFGPQVQPTKSNLLAGLAADLFDKVTFGGGDEVLGAVNAVGDDISSAFGNVTGLYNVAPGSYAERKAQAKALREQYAAYDPTMSTLLNVGALAAPVPGVLNAAKGAGTGVQMLKAGGAGALYGGLTGALSTEGDLVDRAIGAGTLGTIGAAVGGAAVPVINMTAAGVRGAADLAARYGITPGDFLDDLLRNLGDSPEAVRGSIPMTPSAARPSGSSFTPEELFLAKQLKNTPIDKIERGADEIAAAVAADRPLFLPEALQSPKVERNAKFIANFEPSMEFAQDAIRTRTAGAEERAANYFGSISPVDDTFQGARAITQASDDIIKQAIAAREANAAPWYQRAYSENPVIQSPELTQLLEKDQVLSGIIRNLKKTANNADLPDNSTELLVGARKRLWEKAVDLEAKGFPSEAADIKDTYARLNTIMKSESPALIEADDAFSAGSKALEALTETHLSKLAAVSPDKAEQIGQVFSLPARRIAELRQTFADAGKLDEWNAGIRSYLQRAAEGSREGQNYTLKIAGSTLQKDKLRAALGEKADDVISGLDLENRFFEGKNKYFAGSPTQPLQQEDRAFQEAAGFLGKLKTGDWKGAFGELFASDMPEDLAQEMARIYFDPRRGSDAIQKIMPLLEDYARNKAATDALGSAGRFVASRAPGALPASDLDFLQSLRGAAESPRSSRSPATPAEPRSTARSSAPDSKASLQDISYDPTDNLASDLFSTADLRGDSVDPQTFREFTSKVADIADELGTDPGHLMAVMRFETGGTLNPAEKNRAGSGATGLIQFMPNTAQQLTGAETREAAIKLMESMSPVEQLDYVKKYLAPYKGKLKTLDDLYMAILYPKAVGKDSDYVLFERGTTAYKQNRGLDENKDGSITKEEAAAKVRRFNDKNPLVKA